MNGRYHNEDCDQKFTHCLKTSRNQVSIASFFDIAKKNGIDISLPEELKTHRGRPRKSDEERRNDSAKSTERALEIISGCVKLRFNVITDMIEIREVDEYGNCVGEWKRLDDRDFNTLYTRVKTGGVRMNQTDFSAFISSRDYTDDYNPFKEYIENLDEWDQQTDYIEEFFDYFKFESPEVRAFCMPLLKKWFISMVALWLGRTDDNQLMVVLVGPASIGKTFFCKICLPEALKEYSHTIFPSDKMDKDQLIAMSECALVIFDEFEVMEKLVNTLKAIISSNRSDVRAAYARTRKQRMRKASFIGSCNEMQYLANNNNDRRYISVSVVGSRDINEHPLPYEGAYAQARWIIENESPSSYRPNAKEIRCIQEYNKLYTKPDTCVELISKYYRMPELTETGIFVTIADIRERINWCRDPAVNNTNIGKALKKMGILTKRCSSGNKYYVWEILQATREQEGKKAGKEEHDRLEREALKEAVEKAAREDPELAF